MSQNFFQKGEILFLNSKSDHGQDNTMYRFTKNFIRNPFFHMAICLSIVSCRQPADNLISDAETGKDGTELAAESKPAKKKPAKVKKLSVNDISLNKDLLYDQYTLDDHYKYQNQERSFKWKQIREKLALIENMQQDDRKWVVMQNYRNRNQEAPLVKSFKRNSYGRVADKNGVERYQSVPLYAVNDTVTPVIYGRDGSIAHLCGVTGSFYKIETIGDRQEWYVPKRYIKILPEDTRFQHVIVVDRKDQNITALEQETRGKWLIRSKNPATTGRRKPPYAQPTPLGIFLKQEQKRKMIFLKDGSAEHGGYAPYASRFTNGAYIHGVPVNKPREKEIEYSWSLGTTPRSHMCVRNATSHSKFIYDWAPVNRSLVVVIE